MLRRGEVYLVTRVKDHGTDFTGVFFEGDDTWVVFAPWIPLSRHATELKEKELVVPVASIAGCEHLPDSNLEEIVATRKRIQETEHEVRRRSARVFLRGGV